jgi:hypothetical protein
MLRLQLNSLKLQGRISTGPETPNKLQEKMDGCYAPSVQSESVPVSMLVSSKRISVKFDTTAPTLKPVKENLIFIHTSPILPLFYI